MAKFLGYSSHLTRESMNFMMIGWKHLFFRYDLPLMLTFSILLFGVLHLSGADQKVLATSAGIMVTLVFFVQKQKLEELRVFADLFKEFNTRYNDIREELARIYEDSSQGELSASDKEVLTRYFNLCGEEWLYYKHGYLLPDVWQTWHRGMMWYRNDERIRQYWEDELDTDAYYGLKFDP
jgi:hypothetical protein